MTNKRYGCMGLVMLLLLCLSILFNLILIAGTRHRGITHGAPKPREFDETTVDPGSGSSEDKIAIVSLEGLISSSVAGSLGDSMVEDIKTALRQAADDDKVKAILLHIDSPGGEVTAADAIYSAVRKARSKKPVVVYMGSLAASGGYYAACGGTFIMANETTITGSIGVIIETINYQDLMGKIGIQPVVFKSGAFKDILSGSRPMTYDEKAYIQSLVKQTYDKFFGVVSSERHVAPDQLRPLADGRIISGKDALADKLIDGTGQIEDAFEKARNLGNAPGAAVIKYEAKFRFGKLFKMLGETHAPKLELTLPQGLAPQLEPGRLYLLPGF